MEEEIEMPFDGIVPDLTEKQKNEVILEAVKVALGVLISAARICEVPNFINGSGYDDQNNRYELLLIRKKGPAQSA